MDWFFILAVGLVAGTVSGIVGFGSSIMLMPVLVIQYGPRQAVPIMAIAALMANLSRIMVWWREIEWRACAIYSLTAIPAAGLGARTLLAVPQHIIEAALGAFFILMIPVRRWLASHDLRVKLWHLAVVGAVLGYRYFGALPTTAILQGLTIGSSLMAGSYLAKRLVRRLQPDSFRLLMDGLLLLSGLAMLWSAF